MEFDFKRSQGEEALLSAFLTNIINEAAFCVEENSSFIHVDDATCHLLEYSSQELLSMTLLDIAVDFSLEMWSQQWQTSKLNGSSKFQCRLQTKSKQILLTEIVLFYAKSQNREFGCASMNEIAKEAIKSQKIAAKSNRLIDELARKVSLLNSTFDSAACGIIAVSTSGKILNYNQKFLEMWQVPESLVLSPDFEQCRNFFVNQVKNFDPNHQFIWEASNEVADDSFEMLELKDGRVFVQYSKPQQLGEEIIGRVWSIWDATEFKQLLQESEQCSTTNESTPSSKIPRDRVLEEAQVISELRARFFSTMCHQFRSFLNIISFSNSLLRRYVDKATESSNLPYLDNIQTAVEQIGTLLDRLLFLGQSEVGKLNVEPKPTEIVKFCRDLIAQMEAISDSKQQSIKFISQDNLSIACVDGDILEQILINLLSNAIKYTPNNGQITFKLSSQDDNLIFQIEDTGVGISDVEQQRIFEPFYRGSNIDNTSGMGLGLAIVKNLVNLHNGKIEVESQEGVGTTFTAIVPAQLSTA